MNQAFLLIPASGSVCWMNPIMVTGVLVAVISFSLALLARAQLGKSFAFTPQAKGLVTHGLYSRIRNPMYLFIDLTVVGIALATHFWYLACILLVLVPLQIRQSRKEGKLLQEKFGEIYLSYRAKTWF
jgi:protein-S-isoprenylcysteine O-methyltransferase Ste14